MLFLLYLYDLEFEVLCSVLKLSWNRASSRSGTKARSCWRPGTARVTTGVLCLRLSTGPTCQHGLARSLFPIRDVVVLGADGPARPLARCKYEHNYNWFKHGQFKCGSKILITGTVVKIDQSLDMQQNHWHWTMNKLSRRRLKRTDWRLPINHVGKKLLYQLSFANPWGKKKDEKCGCSFSRKWALTGSIIRVLLKSSINRYQIDVTG
jgi:hypothetical protein